MNLGSGIIDPEIEINPGQGGSIVGNAIIFPAANMAGTYNYSGTGVFRLYIYSLDTYIVYRIA
jgi:hypothetical protein